MSNPRECFDVYSGSPDLYFRHRIAEESASKSKQKLLIFITFVPSVWFFEHHRRSNGAPTTSIVFSSTTTWLLIIIVCQCHCMPSVSLSIEYSQSCWDITQKLQRGHHRRYRGMQLPNNKQRKRHLIACDRLLHPCHTLKIFQSSTAVFDRQEHKTPDNNMEANKKVSEMMGKILKITILQSRKIGNPVSKQVNSLPKYFLYSPSALRPM